MSTTLDSDHFLRVIAERKAKQVIPVPPVPNENGASSNGHTEEVIGLEDIDRPFQRTQEDNDIDQITSKANFSVEDSMRKFIAESKPWWSVKRTGTEIQITCPLPAHPDKKPSASFNKDTQLWHCHACKVGGDAIDIAAVGMGYEVGGAYKRGSAFVELRKEIAHRMGYRQEQKTLGNPNPSWLPPPTPPVPPVPVGQVTSITTAPSHTTNTDQITPDSQLDEDSSINLPVIPISDVCKPDTLLDIYFKRNAPMQVPENYHIWNGLMLISGALGRDTYLADDRPVYGNFNMCIVGASGSGKTSSFSPMKKAMRLVRPYDEQDPANKGIFQMGTPQSGEALMVGFTRVIADPSDPKSLSYLPVRALVEFPEYSDLVALCSRPGSTLEGALIGMYDNSFEINLSTIKHGKQHIVEPYCMAVSTIQIKSITGLLTEKAKASGFMNRWVFVLGPAKYQDLFGPDLDDDKDVIQSYTELCAWASGHQVVRAVKNTPGWRALVDMYNRECRPYRDSGDDLFARLNLLTKKLVLLFSANAHQDQVSVDTVERVGALMPYVIESYQIVGARVGVSKVSQLEERILKAVRNFEVNHNGECPNAMQLKKVLSALKITMEELRKTLKYLAELGLVEILPGLVGANGKKSINGDRFQYVAG